MAQQYGVVACAFAILGIGYSVQRNPRVSLAVLSFPVLMLLHMCTNRVHYLRTVGPVFALLPVFVAVGIAGLVAAVSFAAGKWSEPRSRVAGAAVGTLAVALLAHDIDPAHVFDKNIEPDSRKVAAQFVAKSKPEDTLVGVAGDLWFAEDAFESLQTFRLPTALRGVGRSEKLMREGAFVILPHYAPSKVPRHLKKNKRKKRAFRRQAKKAARQANQSRGTAVRQLNLRQVATFGKDPVRLASPTHRPAPTDSPRLAIYAPVH